MRIILGGLFFVLFMLMGCQNKTATEGQAVAKDVSKEGNDNKPMDTYGSLPYSPTDKTEVLYAEAVSQNTMAEKAFCKLAAEKAVSENIKSFAAKIAFENDTVNDPFIQVIIKKRILVIDGLRPKLQKELAALEKAASGFDKLFMTTIIRNYQRSITTYESNLPKLDDVELKRDALSMLAFKKKHLAEAQRLLNEIN